MSYSAHTHQANSSATNERQQENELDLAAYQVRTDLAIEAHDLALKTRQTQETHQHSEQSASDQTLEGVSVHEFEQNGILVSKVHIHNEQGAQTLGKQPGQYLTIDAPELRKKDSAFQHEVTKLIAEQFEQYLIEVGIQKNARCLLVGLGNRHVTPDALGPRVVENVVVTNHLFELQPERVEQGFRSVSAITPGVLGLTGLETSAIVAGIVKQTEPDFIIAIDALASLSIERLNTTIQISNTGIHPGAGIGNQRQRLDQQTVGIPVLAIGVPTVVDAVSIVSDSIDFVMGHLGQRMEEVNRGENKRRALAPEGMSFGFQKTERFDPETIPDEESRRQIMGLVGSLEEQEKRQLIREVLLPLGHQLIVTPKEVDEFIQDMGFMIANGLNVALHDQVNMENVSAYTH